MNHDRVLTECRGVTGWLFGHAFQPRFTVVERAMTDHRTLVTHIATGEGNPVEQDRTYHGDVCRRCGATSLEPQ